MSKPSSLKYPRDLVKQGEKRLRLKLRGIVQEALDGKISKLDARDQGNEVLEKHYKAQIETINAFFRSKELAGLSGYEGYTQNALDEAKGRWKRIIEDIQPEEA